jgi:uracil-DNA glycosylase
MDALLLRSKLSRLDQSHVFPLTRRVESWRTALPEEHRIPYFDPDDGGIHARILLLMEKPGPGPNGLGVEFVSRDNDDPTARNIDSLLSNAGIEREMMVIWNAVPAWNGERRITSQETENAGEALRKLLLLLTDLEVIVAVGRKAQSLLRKMNEGLPRHIEVLQSFHPSNQVKNRWPEQYRSIEGVWREACQLVQ